ncbi:MAG: putative inorganic carbon transporter subunit DabA, partial [Limnobacter sp.]|nr:putative inorganic carbon transporter subunit DabA [Limnobacter sp.]
MKLDHFEDAVEGACQKACEAIAPAWPLDQAIAVNPHWQRIRMPVGEVAARMAVLARIRVLPSRNYVLNAWNAGRIEKQHLEQAIKAVPMAQDVSLTAEQCIDALNVQEPDLVSLPLLIDKLDDDPKRHTRLSWRDAITYQVSQTCAAYFDEFQADWQPQRMGSLYDFWRDTLTHDHGIGLLMGLPDLGQSLSALPQSRQEAERWALRTLGLPEQVWADYLESVLLTVNGWASWCAYLGWQANLKGGTDEHLRELLAIRLAWGAILLDCKHDESADKAFAEVQSRWAKAPELISQARAALVVDEVWQTALETSYQAELAKQLTSSTTQPDPKTEIQVQAAFCIDVRSEPLRRALEQKVPGMQTLGFAGFFGVPLAYKPAGTQAHRAQLPGLLAPALEVTDHIVPAPQQRGESVHSQSELDAPFLHDRQRRLGSQKQWLNTGKWPATAFSYVEAAGIAYLSKLGSWLKPDSSARGSDDRLGIAKRYRPVCRPALMGLGLSERVELAATV